MRNFGKEGKLTTMIAGTDSLTTTKRAELRGRISTTPGLNCYLRVAPTGLLRIDKAKVNTEVNLDGKYLLRCSDPTHPRPAPHPHQAGDRSSQEDHRAGHSRNALTSTNTTARTHACSTDEHPFPQIKPHIHVSRPHPSCGIQE
jgi:hypothetical protein